MTSRCLICGSQTEDGQICAVCEITNPKGLTIALKNERERQLKKVEGLERAIEIIDEEIKFAKEVSSIMCAGMVQIKKLIEEEIDRVMAQ